MRKKIMFLVAVFMFICSCQSFASVNTAVLELSAETGRLTCTAALDVAEQTPVTLVIYKPGYNSHNTTKGNFGDAVLYFNVQPYSPDLMFETVLDDDAPSGYYYADISADGMELIQIKEPVYFASEKEKKAAVNDLNNKLDVLSKSLENDSHTAEAFNDLNDFIAANNKIFSLNLDGIYTEYQNEVLTNLLRCRAEFYSGSIPDITEANVAWRKAVALQIFNSATTENIYTVYETVRETLSFAIDADESAKNAILRSLVYINKDEYLSNVQFSKIEELTKKAVALGMVNSASRTQMSDVLKKYAEELDIDLTKYNTVDKIEANKALEGKEFKSRKEVSEALKNKILLMENETSSSSGGSGSKNSSKGSTPFAVKDITETNPSGNEQGEVFTDIYEADWAKEYIVQLYNKRVIDGKGNNKFEPNSMIAKEEFVKILLNAFSLYNNADKTTSKFSDVSAGEWYAPYINAAVQLDIVKGISDDVFGLGEYISREDIAVITYRALSRLNISLNGERASFVDADNISEYAAEAVSALEQAGVINGMGNGNFEPKQRCTRAQACKIICSALKYAGMGE